MGIGFVAEVVPLADLRVNPSRVVKRAAEEHRPVLVTSDGRGVAVVRSLIDYEKAEEERAFMRAVVAGLADFESVREVTLFAAKARLGLKWLDAEGRHSFRRVGSRIHPNGKRQWAHALIGG